MDMITRLFLQAVAYQLERIRQERRERQRVVASRFDRKVMDSYLALQRRRRDRLGALRAETHETWLEDNCYINMDLLREQKKAAMKLAT